MRLAVLVAVVGCVQSTSVLCEDGSKCPGGTQCATLTTLSGAQRVLCASFEQVAACQGKLDGDSCDLPGSTGGGACHGEVCVVAGCGNGLLDPDEICDDENVSDDDDCSADCRSTLVCGNGVVDVSLGEQCDLGDVLGHDGCASTCQLERLAWVTLQSERPVARDFAALAYDRSRRRVVLFGGAAHVPPQTFPLDDTREWDGQRWHASTSALSPSNRSAHTMAYDAARDELVVFSGVNNQSDTWIRAAGVWQQRVPAHAPPTRDNAGMAYDGARKQIVLFGGYSVVTQDNLGDTWLWNGADWQEVTTTAGPSARLGHAMAYDPKRNVTVLFGGFDSAPSDEVWEFDGTTWTDRTPVTPGPGARTFAAMAFDPITNEVLLTGGRNGGTSYDDAFSWNGTRWLARPSMPATNDVFEGHAMATDPVRQRVVLLGTKGTLYEWNGTALAWTVRPGGGVGKLPLARDGAALALDTARAEVVMFGGESTAVPRLDETWLWTAGWSEPAPQTIPPARKLAAMAYDEVRGEVVMYGGCAASDGLADTWVWRGGDPVGNWTQRSASSPPGKRCEATMAFDAARQKVVLVGGYDSPVSPTYATTTWTWDGSTWTLEPGVSPPARASGALAFDRRNERVVLFGGRRAPSSTLMDFMDTWLWDGAAWTEVTPAIAPPARALAAMAWEPGRGRVVLAGGRSTEGVYAYADAYEWDGASWSAIPSDFPPRFLHGMTTAPGGSGVLIFGGDAASGVGASPVRLADTLRLRWDADVTYEACTDRDGDGDGQIGCADPDCWWLCAPTCSPGTSCLPDAPHCGDQQCNPSLENCVTCSTDCGPCPTSCGDFTCDAGEVCPGDCTP